jgi:hypothetical protein
MHDVSRCADRLQILAEQGHNNILNFAGRDVKTHNTIEACFGKLGRKVYRYVSSITLLSDRTTEVRGKDRSNPSGGRECPLRGSESSLCRTLQVHKRCSRLFLGLQRIARGFHHRGRRTWCLLPSVIGFLQVTQRSYREHD